MALLFGYLVVCLCSLIEVSSQPNNRLKCEVFSKCKRPVEEFHWLIYYKKKKTTDRIRYNRQISLVGREG